MDFTREPIIETIITPKEGHKLVIRSSKSAGQEEYFIDAVEIVSFGQALFFRSLDRPKAFIVPVSDYEVLEVREARMVLKNAGLDRSIKIGGGRENHFKAPRELEKVETPLSEEKEQEEPQPSSDEVTTEPRSDIRVDKKRDRRRHYRKRRGREEEGKDETTTETTLPSLEEGKIDIVPPEEVIEGVPLEEAFKAPNLLSTLLQPPPLISETINRYRQNELFKSAFYLTEEEQYKPHDKVQELLNEEDEEEIPSLQEPTYIPEEMIEEKSASSLFDIENDEKSEDHVESFLEENSEEHLSLLMEDESQDQEPFYVIEEETNRPPVSSEEENPTQANPHLQEENPDTDN